jgi:hypothetical protein
MEEIGEDLLNEIELLLEPAKKELDYISKNNWIEEPSRNVRIKKHKIQENFTGNVVQNLSEFFPKIKAYTNNEIVRNLVETLLKFPETYSNRFEEYKKIQDWSNYPILEEDKDSTFDVELESAFQSGILRNIQSWKNKLKRVTLDSSLDSFVLPVVKNTNLGIMFSDYVFEKYPETKEIVDRKFSNNKK